MLKIDLEKTEKLKNELDSLEEDEECFLCEEGESKYVVLPVEKYDLLDSYRSFFEGDQLNNGNVKIITNAMNELSYDEYEAIRKQLIEVIDKTFKPNPEKFN